MMGDFGGNAGLLSVWFDESSWEWRAEYATCPLGRQHFWWLVHILDLVVVVGVVLLVVSAVLSAVGLDVDGRVERSVARLCTPPRKVADADTPVKGGEVVKENGGLG
jgi:hypothetical protein